MVLTTTSGNPTLMEYLANNADQGKTVDQWFSEREFVAAQVDSYLLAGTSIPRIYAWLKTYHGYPHSRGSLWHRRAALLREQA